MKLKWIDDTEEGPWGFFLPLLIPILILCAFLTHRPHLFLALIFLVVTALTILDFFVRPDPLYEFDDILTTQENDGRLSPLIYEFATGIYLLVHLVMLGMGLYFVQFEEPSAAWFLYAVPIGSSSYATLVLQHEYMHKNNKIEKTIARFFGSLCFWNVHEYEHLFYHHNEDHICTEKDFSYARLNQSIYSYVYLSIISNCKLSWEKQKETSKIKGESFYNIFKNPLLGWMTVSLIFVGLILGFLGGKALALFLMQAVTGVFLYLLGSYNQHYGLTRRIKEDGSLEAFTYMNVWSARQFITNKSFYNGEHHAHHHLFQLCRYPHLKVIRSGPLLPYGYMIIFLVSLLPKLWFKKMNPLVEEVFKARDRYEQEGSV